MNRRKKTLGVIPARFGSSRLPGKPLIQIGGKSMIRRVYEQAQSATQLDEIIVATDHDEILRHVEDFGGKAIMTSVHHPSGTDRCAEVSLQFPAFDQVVNIQGDEPFIQPDQIDFLVDVLESGTADIATLVRQIDDVEKLHNPHIVKALLRGDEAVYFSRVALPYLRGISPDQWLEHTAYFKHLGLYAFRRETLITIAQLAVGRWEKAEHLEQLRWLEAGYRIKVGITTTESMGIDTPTDVKRAEAFITDSMNADKQIK